jgi:hypothetical protein
MMSVGAEPLVQEFPVAERTCRVFGELGIDLETWEALALVRSEGGHLRQELDRIESLRRLGRVARPGGLVLESLARLRQSNSRLARTFRAFLSKHDTSGDSLRVESMLAVALLHPERRRTAEGWVSGAAPTEADLRSLSDFADRCRGAEPAAPAGVDPDLYRDLVATRDFLQSFAGRSSRVELWEVMCLAIEDRAAVRQAADRLGAPDAQASADDLNAGTIRVLEKLLDLRFRWTPLVRALSRFIRTLPTGRYGGDTLDLAIGFILASPEGREHARAWIEDPQRLRREAALRLEGVIGRAQKYQIALRVA